MSETKMKILYKIIQNKFQSIKKYPVFIKNHHFTPNNKIPAIDLFNP
jgi:hypothetical protein